MIDIEHFGTNKSNSLIKIREAGFNPIAITVMVCEEVFVFETEEESTKAHDEFEANPKHGIIIQGWWYGRDEFNETILDYRKKFYENKEEGASIIYWLKENIQSYDSRELYLNSVIKELLDGHSEGGYLAYSEETIRVYKDFFEKSWANNLSPYKALLFLQFNCKRYANGEIILKERMQNEEWYSTLYQPFLEFMMSFYKRRDVTVDEIFEGYIIFLYDTFTEEFENKEQLLRWSVLHCERHNNMPPFEEIERIMNEKLK